MGATRFILTGGWCLWMGGMAWGATVSGKVMDSQGRPLQGVTVNLRERAVDLGVALAQSGPDGSFVLPEVEPGIYDLVVTQEGFAPQKREVVVRRSDEAQTEVNIRLYRWSSIRGKVSFAEGQPAAQAAVRLFDDRHHLIATVGTEEEGTYTFPHVLPGRTYWVSLFAAVPVEKRVQVRPEQEHVIDLTFPEGTISGTVKAASGAPLAEAKVFLVRHLPEDVPLPQAIREGFQATLEKMKILDSEPAYGFALSDQAGKYTIYGVPEGKYAVCASASGYAPGLLPEVQLTAEKKDLEGIDFTLKERQEGTLTVKVVEPDGVTPVQGGLIFWGTGGEFLGSFSQAVQEGQAVFQKVPAGQELVLTAAVVGFADTPIKIRPLANGEQREVTLRLLNGGSIAGKVVYADPTEVQGPNQVPGVRVVLCREEVEETSFSLEALVYAPRRFFWQLSGMDGSFSFDRLTPGRWKIFVVRGAELLPMRAEDGQPLTSRLVEVEDGHTSEVNLAVEPPKMPGVE